MSQRRLKYVTSNHLAQCGFVCLIRLNKLILLMVKNSLDPKTKMFQELLYINGSLLAFGGFPHLLRT